MTRTIHNKAIECVLLLLLAIILISGCQQFKHSFTPPDTEIKQKYQGCLDGRYIRVERKCNE